MNNESVIRVEIEAGERWWGGAVSDGIHMPFSSGFRTDLNDLRGNQGIPALLSNKGRTLWSDLPFAFQHNGSALEILPAPDTDIVVSDGNLNLPGAYRHLMTARFQATGQIPDESLFTEPQYNLWIDQLFQPTREGVLDYARNVVSRGFPPGVLMIDDNWHEHYGSWDFHSGRFPDPEGMIHELHRMGFKVMLWLVPYVSPDTVDFRYLRDAGLLLLTEDGNVAIGEWWNGHGAALDLLNPAALNWLRNKLQKLQDLYGVDGFKFDGGDAPFYANLGCERAERYTAAWNRFGVDFPLNEFRDSWNSAGLALAQRQKDKHHAWHGEDGLEALIPNAIAQSLTGHSYTCPDMIGGGEYISFTGAAFDSELFVRWAQASALFPMMQFSAAPWNLLSPEEVSYCRAAALLHSELGTEITQLAKESAQGGEPILRPLAYNYPQDAYEEIHDQFLLGTEILVAPVLQKGSKTRSVVIPAGRWRADDGREYEGGTTTVHAPLSRLPWFRKISA
ncbi:glycoside hydrolase family 31 protein [Paenarthrobacter nicotinovorans]|uniref:glycoside hydrolase family 31 protein n=1 Tax=Paenarthrobacter nicotinovorans TaxID=29320 RepID=UPI003806B937